ncbi:MAG: formylglycine-generating enzyme family protein [Leptolyngbyaceae cyanobacterium]
MEGSSDQPLDTTAQALIRRVSRTRKGYQEPLLTITDALPLHMVLIPRGTFTMGSPDDEPERYDREGPQHQVTVPAFFMGRYPITQAQYKTVMETNPATKYEADRFVAPDKPVVGVSWQDAVAFCDRLAERTGRPYRLPSEAEWEYACRAGTTTPFYFGKTLSDELANYDASETYAGGPEGEYRNALTPVNYFGLANAFGLSDMHGNVLEWCQDHWHSNYEGAPTDGSAWLSSDESKSHILRGGSWVYFPRYCRSAYRNTNRPGVRYDVIGFRVCCSAPRALQ